MGDRGEAKLLGIIGMRAQPAVLGLELCDAAQHAGEKDDHQALGIGEGSAAA